ncbi:vitamin K epoxide reductase family protein [Phormidium sp. CLA17]|uniref:vitamin K epoxide reductase family protein n=1 Tax=Leptolyngbya sp. Cla-17 TaxID=2803751 RepID=UPI001490F51A|nr:vitamin K epoxide reductase family protein [Leptolyngbya sp. Cla-17]MBM0742391.1 vitamin K epoxide reductase family protein [Leptolyngbya sp. Cla-17]
MSSLAGRRRNVPWIHRWSRQIIGAIAILGAINTAYITITKLSKTVAACPTSGCERVLDSPYATVFGLPLALFGLAAYIGMAVFALAPLAINVEQNRKLRTNLEGLTWRLLFIGATAMTVFSGYLMYIMVTQFVSKFGAGGICYYCIASAVFALSMFVLTLIGRDWEDVGQLVMTGIITLMVTLIATLLIYANLSPVDGRGSDGNAGPAIVNTSSTAEIELAKHLKQIGAKMYGAYWCPHCNDQKELFGKEAAAIYPYVECASDAVNSKAALCQEVAPKIEKQTGQSFGFPTWEIKGQYLTGTQQLTDLATKSGYQGPRNFKNAI